MDRAVEQEIARFFARQHGAVSRRQALHAGVSSKSIRRCLESGRWQCRFPATYVLNGTADSWHRRLSEAALWAGPRAAVSHRGAAALWELTGSRAGIVEISTSRRLRSSSVVIHRTPEMVFPDVTEVSGIPVTTVARTLIDLCAVCKPELVEEALDSALCRRMVSVPFLWRRLNRLGGRGRDGTAALRAMLVARLGLTDHAASVSETRLNRLLTEAGMAGTAQYEIWDGAAFIARVDLAYPDLKLAIEVDSWRWHTSKAARLRDARRQNRLERIGWTVLRFFWEDVEHDSNYVVSEIRLTRARLRRRHDSSSFSGGPGPTRGSSSPLNQPSPAETSFNGGPGPTKGCSSPLNEEGAGSGQGAGGRGPWGR